MKKIFVVLWMTAVLVSCGVSSDIPQVIVDKPIVFNEQRIELTKEYLEDRYNLSGDSVEITPKMIVLHWTAIPTFEGSYRAFYEPTLPSWRPDIESVSGLNVSTHFLVDRDGTIYRLMPETYMGRHVIGLNHCAIGIENVGGTDKTPLTRKQSKANIWLVEYLVDKYDIDYLIGHYEYTQFENHPLWLEVDEGYRTEKTDPGEKFMKRVRQATKKYNFKPVPEK
ncbi:peptidoglycan recognition family protein [Allomuricauda sp. d1]|uniref:peptidoglycan recognition protein family protein n=1 Tax=Allomuricauda sp. d1 TaxID=3136725 RepID=UPI0031E0A1FE